MKRRAFYGIAPPLSLKVRLGLMFLAVAVVPYGIVMTYMFHLEGATTNAVGILVFTLLPLIFAAFLGGHVLGEKIFTEATAAMQRFEEERERSDQLAQLNRMRSRLVSSASHELRTPLSSMCMFLDSLDDNWNRLDDAQRQSIVHRVRTTSRRMNRLVGDLLIAAQIDAGAVPVDPSMFQLAPLIQEAAAEISALHPHTPILLEGPETVLVAVDAQRAQQVFINVLDNAAKFAEPGTPVSVRWDAGEASVNIRVHNIGKPIPDGQVERIFLPFTSLNRSGAASGLGLFISKSLTERMGGTITVESDERGAVLAVALPSRLERNLQF